jgi:hypothetical protein
MGFPVLYEFFELTLQFSDWLFELQLLFHLATSLGVRPKRGNAESAARQA